MPYEQRQVPAVEFHGGIPQVWQVRGRSHAVRAVVLFLASLLCGSFERRVFVARVVVVPVIAPAQLDKPLRHQPVDRLPGDVQLEPCLLLLSDWRL